MDVNRTAPPGDLTAPTTSDAGADINPRKRKKASRA
jgi:hypothetical protein